MRLMMTPVSVLGDIYLFYFLYFSFSVQWAYQSEIEGFDHDKRTLVPILNSCKSMVAWLRAAIFLSHSKDFSDRQVTKVPRRIHSYLRSDVSTMTNLQELMEKTILPRLSQFTHQ